VGELILIADREVVIGGVAELVRLAHDALDLVLRRRDVTGRIRARQNLTEPNESAQPRLRRRVWHEHHVVLVVARRVLTFFREHTDDLKRDVTKLYLRADGVSAGEQILRHRRAEHGDLPYRLHVVVAEQRAAGNAPVTDREIIGRHTVDLGAPVAISANDLRSRLNHRRYGGQGRRFTFDLISVVGR